MSINRRIMTKPIIKNDESAIFAYPYISRRRFYHVLKKRALTAPGFKIDMAIFIFMF